MNMDVKIDMYPAYDSLEAAHAFLQTNLGLWNGIVVSVAEVKQAEMTGSQVVISSADTVSVQHNPDNMAVHQSKAKTNESTESLRQPSGQNQSSKLNVDDDFEMISLDNSVNRNGCPGGFQHNTAVVLDRLQQLQAKVNGEKFETKVNSLNPYDSPESIAAGACDKSLVLDTTEIINPDDTWSGYVVKVVTSTTETISTVFSSVSSYISVGKS